MKSKKVLPLISLLFVAIMLFSVGMIVKEHASIIAFWFRRASLVASNIGIARTPFSVLGADIK